MNVDDPAMTVTPLDALVRGPASVTGTVVLHGAGGTPEFNVPFLDDLTRSGRVICPYYPGTGPSPRAADALQLDELADRTVSAADAAGVERFNLLGYSLGSAVAVRIAARHPDRISRIVLTAGLAHASTSLRLACGVWIALLKAGDSLTLGRFLVWASSSESEWRHRSDDPDAIALEIAANAPDGSAAQADLARRLDVRADLSQVRAPTLVVVPRDDRLVDPAHSAELAHRIPGARLLEIGGGHVIVGPAADEWPRAVFDHFDLVEGAPTCA
ncbi:alpha/beta fold hydrolase [Sciscionella marina]|uniref:alpha/beta fold hydrolase n=1 Tax=Sciscionella marina TaxID=508770 RepID=UPI0003A70D58|nr:alpha/beta fold hydrolase [Sciscionella marina]